LNIYAILLTIGAIRRMKINLWYSECMSQWRWTLCTERHNKDHPDEQHSGQRPFLRDAMNDVANTVEYILDAKENE